MMRAIVVGLLALALAACGSVPRPFQPEEKDDLARALMVSDGAGVAVRPFAGADPALTQRLAQGLAEALNATNVPASIGRGNALSHVATGHVTLDPFGGATLIVSLARPDGTRLGERAITFDARALRDDRTPQPVLGEVAGAIAQVLQPHAVTPAARRRVAVREITGAPGGGERVLARALESTLRGAGLDMTEETGADTLLVRGVITITAQPRAMSQVRVEWTVLRPDGGTIGQVRQENQVPTRVLEQSWSDIAFAVAENAADGILDLIERGAR